jgi:single-strand DNA-binding protein
MASHNSWTFSGNLGGDPETREAGGSTVCNFSVAVNGRRDSDPTTWVRVAAWGKLGEMCGQYLAKGRQVIVTGAARLREYEGKNGKGVSLEVDAREVTFIGGRDDAQGGGGDRPQRGGGSGWGDAPSKPSGAWGGAPASDDKVPF